MLPSFDRINLIVTLERVRHTETIGRSNESSNRALRCVRFDGDLNGGRLMCATRPTKPDRRRSRDWPIEQLPGLSDRDSQKLIACGILTTHQLCQQAGRPAQQEALAVRLRLRVQQIKKWVALADLARVPNVGLEYCGLLLHCGVGSTAQLSQLSVHRLHPQIRRFQVATLQRQDLCPGPDKVTLWIQQARQLSQ